MGRLLTHGRGPDVGVDCWKNETVKARLGKLVGTAGTTNKSARVSWIEAALAAVPPGLRLLDAGAGEQPYRHFCAHLEYVSQDFAQYKPREDPAGLHRTTWDDRQVDIVSDITEISEPDGSFDVVLCTEVLEHLPYPVEALREFARLLRSGGLLIATAPFCSLTHFAPYHFSTGFSRYFYQRVLHDLDFDVLEVTANGNYFEYIAQEIRRLPYVASRYTSRRIPLAKVSIGLLLMTLARLSNADAGSSELLTFGFHVRARRH